jgi:ribosomal protein S18 acetylase RimI-like enzyme
VDGGDHVEPDIDIRLVTGILGRSRIHALEAGEVVGRLEFQVTEPGELTIWSVQVAADVRRRGVATRMVDMMLRLHHNTERLRLHQVSEDGAEFWPRVAATRNLALEDFRTPPPQF